MSLPLAKRRQILQVRGLSKRFGGVTALNAVSFDLLEGEVHALCGENGAGKSTLIKVLCGVHPAGSYEGEVRVNGRAASFRDTADARSAGIAVIHQELALIGEMSVAENLFLGEAPRRGPFIDWNLLYSKTRSLVDRYSFRLDPAARVRDLGVGQQQLVEILKALSKQSRIVLLDEPTAALTETEVDILLGIVRGLREKGITCVYISHRLDEVFAIADRITVLRDGQAVVTLDRAATSRDEVIRHMVGRELKELFPQRRSIEGEPLLEVEDLTVRMPGRRKPVLDGISFRLHAGEVLGFGGFMGAGRTELLNHIFGVYGERTSGTVRLAGKELPAHAPPQSIRRGLVLAGEDRKRSGLFLGQSVGFNLSLSSLRKMRRGALIDRNLELRRNEEFMRRLSVRAPGQEAAVASLSGGNQQKVVLGKVLMPGPRVVLLDEPTRGIDVGARSEIYEIINGLTGEGKGVVMVSSDLPELIGMSDRILILSQGRIAGVFDGKAATQETLARAAMMYA